MDFSKGKMSRTVSKKKKSKRRSDIAKLVSAARDIWRFSEAYQEVKKEAQNPGRKGWFLCKKCGQSREVIRIDHIDPIGTQPDALVQFGGWLLRLFCSKDNLQPLCMDCYREKNERDRIILKSLKIA